MYQVFVHFKLTCVCDIREGFSCTFHSVLFAYIKFSCTTREETVFFPFGTFVSRFQILVSHIYEGLFLDSHSDFIHLFPCFYTHTILFWWLALCGVVWNQEMSYLQLCSFSQRLFWLLSVSCDSMLNLEFLLFFPWKWQWDFHRDCTESKMALEKRHFNNANSLWKF